MTSPVHKIFIGDNRDMAELADQSVHLIVTSPPYWQLKDYGHARQTGFDDDYETYINHLNLTWRECCRVLHDGCRLCVNVGDQFARAAYYGRYKIIPIHSEIIRFCEVLGFDFMGQIIWQKTTTMNTSGGANIMGSFPYPRNGIIKLDFEYILLFKKPGEAPRPTPEQKRLARLTTEQWNTYFSGHWYFPGAKQEGHLAMFPEELPRRLIQMFSFPGETVLDPFAGSGTTTKAAETLGRSSVGYEINADYLPVIKKKTGLDDMFSTAEITPTNRAYPPGHWAEQTAALPYRFTDPHQLDKKVDVKNMTYGSKIAAGNSSKREEFFRVSRIISPELIQLSDNKIIRLIGIRPDPAQKEQAIKFLSDKIGGRRVFLRHDALKLDDDGHLWAYLYLENKTFVNTHLIRSRHVFVDNSRPHKYMKKFNALSGGA
ncbi:MAG: site-specific DNA-methyltransferase [Candidatus Adiutrix sp.]|jgi:site-specific DNA-methyltransferase (adenine-specific)|nr:site-specific DNA-methyltransferase [Candidatus Adiutrix sp.]